MEDEQRGSVGDLTVSDLDQQPQEKSDLEIGPTSALSVIITAYHEEEALPKLYEELMTSMRSWERLELIIVNDGSRDRTLEVIYELEEDFVARAPKKWAFKVISFTENKGMGAALKAGYHLASQPWVTFLPGDGQIEPRMIHKLCERAHKEVELITTRYTNREYSLFRKVLSRGLRLITLAITWVNITSEGIYLIRRDTLRSMPLISDSFMLNLEIPIRAAEQRLKIEIASIEVRERQGGVSHATQWRRIRNTFRDLIILKARLLAERWRG